jgi:hypothetical protein
VEDNRVGPLALVTLIEKNFFPGSKYKLYLLQFTWKAGEYCGLTRFSLD